MFWLEMLLFCVSLFFLSVLSRVELNHGREVLITDAARLKAYRPTF